MIKANWVWSGSTNYHHSAFLLIIGLSGSFFRREREGGGGGVWLNIGLSILYHNPEILEFFSFCVYYKI